MTRKRPVGTAEKHTLAALLSLGGSWSEESSWVWESRHWTLRILHGLAAKGYVLETQPDQFELTDAGLALAGELPHVALPRPHAKGGANVNWLMPGGRRPDVQPTIQPLS